MFYYLKKNYGKNIATVIFILITSALRAISGLILTQTLQELIRLDFNKFIFWSLMTIVVFFFAIWSDCAKTFFEARAIRAMNNRIRYDLAATLSQKDYCEFHKIASGEYLSWFTNDVNQVETLAWKPFFSCIECSSLALFSAVALVTIHWILLVAAMLIIFIMIVVPRLFNKRMESLGRICTQKQARSTDDLKDLLLGYDIFRSFNRIARFFHGIGTSSDRIEVQRFRLEYIKSIISSSVNCINLICQIAFDTLIGFLSFKGIILQGAFLGGANLCSQLTNATSRLAELLLSFSTSKPYFDKITTRIEDVQSGHEKTEKLFSRAITLDNVSFNYGEDNILSCLSFRFEKGGKYALVGPSGVGKTTVLKLLLGWLPNYQGSITFDDIDARTYTVDQIQNQISYIGQDIFLFNTTIKDNITLGEHFTEEQIQKAIKDSALKTDLDAMPRGIDTMVGENGANISGGQKQRVAIARALIHNRSILLIDEGTSALDQENANIIESVLLSNPDLTLIMISHHLSPENKNKFTKIYDLQHING